MEYMNLHYQMARKFTDANLFMQQNFIYGVEIIVEEITLFEPITKIICFIAHHEER